MCNKGMRERMTNKEFVGILEEVVKDEGSNILSVPGVYETLSEFFNNEVLKIWTERQNN
jgi:hypothetical protein